MEKIQTLNDGNVVTVKNIRAVPFSSKIALENAFDEFHVTTVHSDTVKRCCTIQDYGDVSIMLYEVYTFKFIKYFTKSFIVIKTSTKDTVNFFTMPVSDSMKSYFTVRALHDENGNNFVEHTFRLRISKLFKPLLPLIIYLRNKGENQRWEEDYELMMNRSKALESGHKDNPQCLERKFLLKEWFGEDVS